MSARHDLNPAALDRWITGNYGEDQFRDEDFEEYEIPDAPEPCDACDFVGMHGEGCPEA